MTQSDQIKAVYQTAEVINRLLNTTDQMPWRAKYEEARQQAEVNNPWFTQTHIATAFSGIVKMLEYERLESWIHQYQTKKETPKDVGVIMAGNIPMAGFHDFLCVLLSGNRLIAKLSGSDKILLPFIADLFLSFLPAFSNRVVFTDRLKDVDAVIATGSNNTARYFDYYFGKKPHIFRKNRNSAAVIRGNENEYDFVLLGRDIFTYFGLGCRNVSKLFVPKGYEFNIFFENMLSCSDVMQHTKYMNNVDYHQALYLMNKDVFLTNNFIILKEDASLASPVGVLHYEFYNDEQDLQNKLHTAENELQCVVSKTGFVPLGQAQFPEISDYADGVDTMRFLTSL